MSKQAVPFTVGFSVLLCCFTASSVEAKAADPKDRAEAYFSEGEALFESGDYDGAAAAFVLAYQTLPHYAVLANIGLSYERSGAFPLAVEYFRRYLAALSDDGKDNPRVRQLLQETLSKVSEIEVSSECAHQECRVYADNVDKGVSPLHLVVVPGEHELRLVSDGRTLAVSRLTVGSGETKACLLSEIKSATGMQGSETSGTDSETNRRPPKPDPRKKSGMGIPFWVSTVSAVGSGIAAGILWGSALHTKKDFDKAVSLDEQTTLKDKGERLQTGALITTGIGGAAAVTAVVLAITRMASSKSTDTEIVSVNVSPEVVGVTLVF